MTDKPAHREVSAPPASHCWLEVPDLRSVDHETPAHLLLVGLAAQVAQDIRSILQSQSHRVTQAVDWDQALRLLEEHPDLELIICAQDTPGPAGQGLEHYLAEPHLLSSLPVLVACQGADLRPLMGLLASGAVDFLNHPFNPQELAVRVMKSVIQYRTMRLYLRAAHRDPPHRALQQAGVQ